MNGVARGIVFFLWAVAAVWANGAGAALESFAPEAERLYQGGSYRLGHVYVGRPVASTRYVVVDRRGAYK